MFSSRGGCSVGVAPLGLRRHDDTHAVLICREHLDDLRRLRPREAENLCDYLRNRFMRETYAYSDEYAHPPRLALIGRARR
jgi:hypothetical protein